MNVIEELSNRNIIKLSNNFILSKIKIKEVSLNIFLMLLSEIDMNDEEFRIYDISLGLIEKKLDKKLNRNIKEIDKIVNDLRCNNLCLKDEEYSIPLCAECEIIKEDSRLFLRVAINPQLKSELIKLDTSFTTIDLRHILRIRGLYSKRMYMLLKKMSSLGHWKVSVEDLHNILGLPSSYNRYDNFKSRVLISSIKQINDLENKEITVSFTEDKRGSRKVKVLNFKINKLLKHKKNTKKLTKEEIQKEKWRTACDPKTYGEEESDDNS